MPSAPDWGWLIVPKQSRIVLKTIENEGRTREEQGENKTATKSATSVLWQLEGTTCQALGLGVIKVILRYLKR